METDKKMIEFSIPDFYHLFDLNLALLNAMEENPEYFRENVKITSTYGVFPGCIWDAYCRNPGQSTYENILNTIVPFNDRGISVRLTFNNSKIEKNHLYDTYCNEILKISTMIRGKNDVKNGVISNSDILDEYIEKNYPSLTRIWSDEKIKSIEELNDLSSDRLVVYPYDMNNSEFLNDVKHPDNVEIDLDNFCIEHCQYKDEHHSNICELQLLKYVEYFRCPYLPSDDYYDVIASRGHYVPYDYINDIYVSRGITKFRILGGTKPPSIINTIESYVNYLVKPELKDNARNKLLRIALYH